MNSEYGSGTVYFASGNIAANSSTISLRTGNSSRLSMLSRSSPVTGSYS